MSTLTVKQLITEPPLSYCCVWKFLTLYQDTSMVASRLGVSDRIIRRWRQKIRVGMCQCEGAENCMKVVQKRA